MIQIISGDQYDFAVDARLSEIYFDSPILARYLRAKNESLDYGWAHGKLCSLCRYLLEMSFYF